MYVNAIEKYTNINPVPNAPNYIEGIINLRGDVIPVYSLRTKFRLPDSKVDDNTKLIITKTDDILLAFQVDSVQEILELNSENVNETPKILKTTNTAYIGNVANVDGRMIILMNLKGILSDSEQKNIEEILEKFE
jgi:purine-binding chemotaxis protein CheW